MSPWDILDYDWPWGTHPAVIVSNHIRVQLKQQVVVLSCRTLRPGQVKAPEANEAMLNNEDGLDWATVCRCDLLWTVDKASLKNHRGTVCAERRRDIARKIIQGLAIAAL
jgi:mRNA-degrading endonuclease toxin of MazEF toxin-antitoxin module